jgi:hypothetical protein
MAAAPVIRNIGLLAFCQALLLCFGTLLAGTYNAFGQQYRFAAADTAVGEWSRNLWTVQFSATYAMLSVFGVIALATATLWLARRRPAAAA